MRAVHLAPVARAVLRQPQVWFLHVSEEEELAQVEVRTEAEHVVARLPGHLTSAVHPPFSKRSETVTCERPSALPNGQRSIRSRCPGYGRPARYGHPDDRGVPSRLKLCDGGVPCSLPPVTLPLVDSLRHSVTARGPARALEDVPPFANTAVDGYAVRAADTADAPVELPVVGDGRRRRGAADAPVGRGEAVRIMTGAPMPDGADAVVMVEDTERLDDGAWPCASRSFGRATLCAMSATTCVRGDLLFAAGTVVRPAMLGVLASVNHRSSLVHPRARVAVLSTGDELVTDGGAAAARADPREQQDDARSAPSPRPGATPSTSASCATTRRRSRRVLRVRPPPTCDAIVTSGGVSMGDYDVVKAVLSRIADMRWMQIAIKPAKPFAFGTARRHAGVRAPGQPRVVDRQLRAARPAGAAAR